MTTMLNLKDTEFLAKLLGMLGSEFDGEVLSAAHKAQQLISDRGLTWLDVIRNVPPVPNPRPQPAADRGCITPGRAAEWALGYAALLAQHEVAFLRDVGARTRRLSPKQAAWLNRIVRYVEEAVGTGVKGCAR